MNTAHCRLNDCRLNDCRLNDIDWPFNVSLCQMSWKNWKIIYDFVHVLLTNIGHSMYRFLDISPDMSKRSVLTLKMTFKMNQNEPSLTFLPWKWPLDGFNQIHLITVHYYQPGKVPYQNKEQVMEQILSKWTICVKMGKNGKLRSSRPWKWPVERLSQIHLQAVDYSTILGQLAAWLQLF